MTENLLGVAKIFALVLAVKLSIWLVKKWVSALKGGE